MKEWAKLFAGFFMIIAVISSFSLFIVYLVSQIDWHEVAKETGSIVGSFKEGMEQKE